MKNLLLLVIFFVSTSAQALENTYFENTNTSVEATNLKPSVLEAHRVLALMSRLSVYALLCGNSDSNSRFSALYRSLFTEENRGLVRYGDQSFANPIESMRNKAMLKFMRAEQSMTGGRSAYCTHNRAEFNNFIYMNSSQLKAYSRLNETDQLSYLNTVRSVAQSPTQMSTQVEEQPQIQIEPDSE